MKYQVEIDNNTCIGCGACSVLAPEVFGFDNENNTSLVREDANLSNVEVLLKAARACPVLAITVKDLAGKALPLEE